MLNNILNCTHLFQVFKGLMIAYFFLQVINAAAQNNFKSASVILNSGDSLYGEISYQSDILMGKKCMFKNNADQKIIVYKPIELRAYSFREGRKFVSKRVDGKSIFLEYLFKGKLEVYTLKDNNGLHYYIGKITHDVIELPYEEYVEFRNGQRYIHQSEIHQNRLMHYTSDAKELMHVIESIKKPHHRNLIALAKEYQRLTCREDSCESYEKKFPEAKIAIELVGGSAHFGRDLNVSKGWHFEHGALIYLSLPLNNENLYFKTGIVRMQLQYTGEELKSNVLKFPLQLEYLFPTKIIAPRVSLGCNIYLPMNVSLAAAVGMNVKLSKIFYWYWDLKLIQKILTILLYLEEF